MTNSKAPTCKTCNDTGVWETGNNDLACPHCPLGDTALFNCAGIDGPITGAEARLFYDNGAPYPVPYGTKAVDLPTRHGYMIVRTS